MKTAYELAMERLGRSSPSVKLTDKQKRALAELEAVCKAKIAEREIALNTELERAQAAGEAEAMEKAREQMAAERRKLQAELEEKKDQVRLGQA